MSFIKSLFSKVLKMKPKLAFKGILLGVQKAYSLRIVSKLNLKADFATKWAEAGAAGVGLLMNLCFPACPGLVQTASPIQFRFGAENRLLEQPGWESYANVISKMGDARALK